MNKALRIAYIAKYAPPVDSSYPVPAVEENAVYSRYHYDIYSFLKEAFPNLITGTDASYIINHHDEIDYIFSLLNRDSYRNSEIFISALAEYYGIPYLGARPNIRALAEDKSLGKAVAVQCGLETPQWFTVNAEDMPQGEPPFEGPYFVKPRFGASSQFIDEDSICKTWKEAQKQISFLQSKGIDVIIEKFVDGIYYSSPVIAKQSEPIVLPPVQEKSTHKGNIVTYRQKRKVESGLTRTVETNFEIVNKIQIASKVFYRFIQPIDYTRIDYILEPSGHLQFIEFNVCCNLGIQSAFVLSAMSAGMTHKELVQFIVNESLVRQNLR